MYEYAGYRVEDGVPAIVRKGLFYAGQKKVITKKKPQEAAAGGRRLSPDRETGLRLLGGRYGGHVWHQPVLG